MSPAACVLSEAPEQVVPFSARLAARLAIAVDSARSRNRREHARLRAADLDWLQSVRLTGTSGLGVALIDLSEGGALIEVDGPLRPGTRLALELRGQGFHAAVPFEVLRSQIASLRGGAAYYRGACVFAHLIDLPEKPAAAEPQSPFVGTEAALSYLVEHAFIRGAAGAGASGPLLDPREVVAVLESLRARGPAGQLDPLGRNVSELIGAVLPALQRGTSRGDAVEALEDRLRTLPPTARQTLLSSSTRLTMLINRCLPPPPAPALESAAAPSRPAYAPPAPPRQANGALQKIVVRYADGSLAKGFTQDFHPSRAHFSLWPGVNARPSERVSVPLARLKAVFFVRDFDGNPAYRERKIFTPTGQGRRIEVTFADTEVILGTTLNYRPDAAGFFVQLADPASNNTRVFVVAAAVRSVRFP